MAKKLSRKIFIGGAALLVGGALFHAFMGRPVLVDMGEVTRGAMMVTIDEDARTRVSDAYVVSTPIAGRLLRVEVEPGDVVTRDKSIVARMLPTNPAALDIRTREQARAAIAAAEAALRVAQADLNKAMADQDLAQSDVARARRLFDDGIASRAALDRAEREWRTVEATVDTARAAISMRNADLANARARLISFEDPAVYAALGVSAANAIPLTAPVDGRILRIIQQSETTLPAGAPVLEIGDTEKDLEIVVELLSTDAVQISEGDRVIIDNWGGPDDLEGVVARVDPWGFTRYSALGVEEQRVNAVIRFTGQQDRRKSLGHGFRVNVRIVVWEDTDTLIVPSSALFRDQDGWAVFVADSGDAVLRQVEVGRNNGIEAQLLGGLTEGEKVILYPSAAIDAGTAVAERSFN